MSVTTRTNRATDPRATGSTGWAYNYGTGGTAAPSNQTSGGPASPSVPTFKRLTWSVATTSPSGWIGYNTLGLTAGVVHTGSLYVRASKAQTVVCQVDWYNGATYISTSSSANIVLTANTWTPISNASMTAPAGATNSYIYVNTAGSGSNWASGDTLDATAVLFEASSVVGSYFDGSFVNAASVVYAWTGTANASTSTAITYVPTMTLVQGSTPSPNVQITYQDFDPLGDTINVWRTVDGKRRPVRGARRRTVVGSDFVTDYEVALGRTTSYDIEVLTGVCAGAVITTATTTYTSSAAGYISDPLQPGTAVAVYADVGPSGEPGLDWDALAAFEYKAAVTKLTVAGTDEPVALVGQRQAAGGIDVNVTTLATSQTAALRVLVKQAGVLLFRPLSTWASALPGLCYLVAPSIIEQSVNEKMGGQMVEWKARGDIVAPPAANIVAPTITYGTVSGNYATYAAFNAAHTSQTYLDVIKNP